MSKQRSSQANGLEAYHQRQREAMYARIDETMQSMREQQITITKKALAEELNVQEKTLYSPYIKEYLLNFVEFNPALQEEKLDKANSETLKQECDLLKLKNRELTVKNKELTAELKKEKDKNVALNQKYELILGKYQAKEGAKIIPK